MKINKIKCSSCKKYFFGTKTDNCMICGAEQTQLIEIVKNLGAVKIALILLGVYVLYLLIVEEPQKKGKTTEVLFGNRIEVNNDNKSNPLFDPNKTCYNFIFDGYYHYEWKIIANSWSCSSISENGISSTQNEVTFYAESNSSDKIESIEILAEIFNVSIKEKIIKEFKNKLKGFFEKSEVKLPDSLINHINIEANYNLTMSDLDISFEVDRSFPNDIYHLLLTIKPMKTKSVYTSKVIKEQKTKENSHSFSKGIPIDKDAIMIEATTEQIEALVALVRLSGYTCDSVISVAPFLLSEGYTLKCNRYRYKYEIVNKGGNWIVKVL